MREGGLISRRVLTLMSVYLLTSFPTYSSDHDCDPHPQPRHVPHLHTNDNIANLRWEGKGK
jgi:hypothetical protein